MVDASTVVATHISNILQSHASELLGREETQALVDHVAKDAPKLVEELVPKIIPIGTLQKVLQNLLTEGIGIRDMKTVLETLAEHVTITQDIDELTAVVRVALSRAIVAQLFPGMNELSVLTLDPQLESILASALTGKQGGGLEPGLAEGLLQSATRESDRIEQQGLNPVLLTPPGLRPVLSKFLRRALPQLAVLSHNEIPDNKNIRVVGVVGGRS